MSEPTDEFKSLYIPKTEAIKRGMLPHAGPYNPHMEDERVMLRTCLEDFRLRPERSFALVGGKKQETCRDNSNTMVWADGRVMMAEKSDELQKTNRDNLVWLREIML